jgi:hypothetical protein
MVIAQHYVAVVEYDYERQENRVASVRTWTEWITIPIEKRPLNTFVVKAKDEIEAFIKATKGETIYDY